MLVHAAVDKAPDPEDVKPGWLGFGVFLALAVAVVLLWLSMRKQLKKVDFEVPGDEPTQGSSRHHPRHRHPAHHLSVR